MWKCLKCGRAFRNENQHHFCGKAPETIDAYICEQREEIRPLLEQVRNAIREVLPEATEKIAWQMPTYWQGKNLIHFAAFKKHIGLYPGDEAVAYFKEALERHQFKYSKGSIQIPCSGEIPIDFIKEIATWTKKYTK